MTLQFQNNGYNFFSKDSSHARLKYYPLTSTPHRIVGNLPISFIPDHAVDTLRPVLLNSDSQTLIEDNTGL